MTAPTYSDYTSVRNENNVLAQSKAQISDGMRTDNQQSVFVLANIRTLDVYQKLAWILYLLVWLILLVYVFFWTKIPLTRSTQFLLVVGFLLWSVLAFPIEYQVYRAVSYLSAWITGTPYIAPSSDYFPMMSGVKF